MVFNTSRKNPSKLVHTPNMSINEVSPGKHTIILTKIQLKSMIVRGVFGIISTLNLSGVKIKVNE